MSTLTVKLWALFHPINHVWIGVDPQHGPFATIDPSRIYLFRDRWDVEAYQGHVNFSVVAGRPLSEYVTFELVVPVTIQQIDINHEGVQMSFVTPPSEP